MKTKISAKIISAICLLSMLVISLAGCGGFFGEQELIIESVNPKTLEDGSIQITITYVDNVKDPDVFVVEKGPQGEVGLTGRGVVSIDPMHDEERNVTVLTVTYTDGTVETHDVPDSSTIENIGYVTDEISGQLYFEVRYTTKDVDGVVAERYPIDVPENGKDGKDGAKITQAECIQINEDFSAVWQFTMSDDSTFEVTVPIAPGIAGITFAPDPEANNDYKMVITYTTKDDEGNPITEEHYINRPSEWIHGEYGSDGPSVFIGKVGDYAFDNAYRLIWHKERLENGDIAWVKVANLNATPATKFDVTFHYDNADEENGIPEGTKVVSIREGSNFYGDGYSIPTPPEREGYVFGGWYTKRGDAIDLVTMGAFNDLTVVMRDTDLYPLWIAE